MEDRIQYGMKIPRPRGFKAPKEWTSPDVNELLIKLDEYSLKVGHLMKRGNSFYYIDQFNLDMGKVALFCQVQGCGYYIGDYKELFRHLRKVHGYKLLQLPKALVSAVKKTGKPG